MELYYVFTFLLGGSLTTTIVFCELNGFQLLSRLAALFPVFTWLSYLLLGIKSAKNIEQHTLFVLLGTIFAWIPYMFFIYYFVPKIGPIKAILGAMVVFLILATIFSVIYQGKS